MRELKPLKLERAQFSAQIEGEGEGPEGLDRVEFWVRTNPGTRPGPLMKVASGGELSRFLLALKVVLADRGSAPTLVFDEIDTGVGGAVADAIGERLARLADRRAGARGHPRAAGGGARRPPFPDRQGRARQGQAGRRPASTELDAERRREEIARMLAGADDHRRGARRRRAADPAPRASHPRVHLRSDAGAMTDDNTMASKRRTIIPVDDTHRRAGARPSTRGWPPRSPSTTGATIRTTRRPIIGCRIRRAAPPQRGDRGALSRSCARRDSLA